MGQYRPPKELDIETNLSSPIGRGFSSRYALSKKAPFKPNKNIHIYISKIVAFIFLMIPLSLYFNQRRLGPNQTGLSPQTLPTKITELSATFIFIFVSPDKSVSKISHMTS